MAVYAEDNALSTANEDISTATAAASANCPQKVWVENHDGSIVVTVGGSDVANGSKGMKLAAGGRIGPIELTQPQEKLYAIAASGTPSISVLVTGV